MNTEQRLLIADDMHPALMDGLAAKGIAFDYRPDISEPELRSIISDYSALVVRSKIFVDRTLMDAAADLRYVFRAGSGMDNIDVDVAAERGIVCINAAEANSDAVGEHAVGMLLSLTRNICRAHEEVSKGVWKREANRGMELTDMTVGIIGFGNTGKAFARKLSGFGCRILFYDKIESILPTPGTERALMNQVLEQADVLSFHVPLDETNSRLINKELINRAKRPFYLLNLSRGGIMETRDVMTGLDEGKILGAALDVLENEQPATWNDAQKQVINRLVSSGRVVLTPHIGGWTFASYRKISEVLLQRIISELSND